MIVRKERLNTFGCSVFFNSIFRYLILIYLGKKWYLNSLYSFVCSMNKKIWIWIGIIFFAIVWFFILSLSRNKVLAPGDVSPVSKLASYEGTFLGDNSKVSQILHVLGGYDTFSLQTTQKPYVLIVEFFNSEKVENQGLIYTTDKERDCIFSERANTLFFLIPNLDKVVFKHSGNSVFSISRATMESLLGKRFSEYEGNYKGFHSFLDEKWVDEDYQKSISEHSMHFPEGMMSQEFVD